MVTNEGNEKHFTDIMLLLMIVYLFLRPFLNLLTLEFVLLMIYFLIVHWTTAPLSPSIQFQLHCGGKILLDNAEKNHQDCELRTAKILDKSQNVAHLCGSPGTSPEMEIQFQQKSIWQWIWNCYITPSISTSSKNNTLQRTHDKWHDKKWFNNITAVKELWQA